VTPAAVTRVLPSAILWDLALAPVAFWLASRLTRVAPVAASAPALEFSYAQRLAAAFRPASSGAAPFLGLAGTGTDYHRPPRARAVPRLRLSSGGPLTGHRPAPGPGQRSFPVAGSRPLKISFGDLAGRAGAGRRAVRAPGRGLGRGWLGAASGSAALGRPGPGTSALRSGRPPVRRAPARGWLAPVTGGRSAATPRLSHLSGPRLTGPRSASDALAARSAPSGLSALSGGGTPLGRRSPSAGWLRSGRKRPAALPSARRLAPRRGWLGGGRPRTVIGSTVSNRSNVTGSRGTGRGGAFRGSYRRRRGAANGQGKYGKYPRGGAGMYGPAWRPGRAARLLRMVGVGK
jgi:hypothetical protein